MKIDDALILNYIKKIFGFAYSKTGNTTDAEDLSQDIIVTLLDKRTNLSSIENMDAYVYRICCYTWSNYFRKNKPQWEAAGNSGMLDFVFSYEDIEESYIKAELSEKLRQEIAYLSKTRREITIMYYYDGKSGDEIYKLLNIPASMIRWHMGETKKILKERINMNHGNEIYRPIKLWVSADGWAQNDDMYGLRSDIIMQNICWICRNEPMSIEKIATTLSIAAIYIEDKIEKLLYMDYLKTVGANQYQTNFYIRDNMQLALISHEFLYRNTMKIALPIYEAAKELVSKYRNDKVLEGDFSDDFLMYSIIMVLICNVGEYVNGIAAKKWI